MLSLLISLANYQSEKAFKQDTINLARITKMNEDMKNLLLNLPKPLLIIDIEEKQVALANKELCNLLSVE